MINQELLQEMRLPEIETFTDKDCRCRLRMTCDEAGKEDYCSRDGNLNPFQCQKYNS